MARRKTSRPANAAEPDMERVAGAVREVIRAVGPELKIERKWGNPWYVGRDLVVLVGAFGHHVGVEFWRGSSLKDPSHLLEGTGKNLRHVKLRQVADATRPAMLALLREAIRLDQVEERRVR
jgi:hypothetical protein